MEGMQGLRYERKINGLGFENFRLQIVAGRLGRCGIFSLKSYSYALKKLPTFNVKRIIFELEED